MPAFLDLHLNATFIVFDVYIVFVFCIINSIILFCVS